MNKMICLEVQGKDRICLIFMDIFGIANGDIEDSHVDMDDNVRFFVALSWAKDDTY